MSHRPGVQLPRGTWSFFSTQLKMVVSSKEVILDLFCGAGGFSDGLRASGMQPAIGVDLNEDALATYAQNFPHD